MFLIFDSHCCRRILVSVLRCSLYFSDTECKSFIFFGRIKRQSKACWSVEVEEASAKEVSLMLTLPEAMKHARLTSPLPDIPHLSSPRSRLKHNRRIALLSHPNLTLNLCALSFVPSLVFLPHLLTSSTVPLPGSRLRSSPIT